MTRERAIRRKLEAEVGCGGVGVPKSMHVCVFEGHQCGVGPVAEQHAQRLYKRSVRASLNRLSDSYDPRVVQASTGCSSRDGGVGDGAEARRVQTVRHSHVSPQQGSGLVNGSGLVSTTVATANGRPRRPPGAADGS